MRGFNRHALLVVLLCLLAGASSAAPSFLMVGGRGSSGTPGGGGGGGAGACVDGSTCLCDTITTSSPLLLCQDWESTSFYEDTTSSWRRGDGSPHDRGRLSLWTTYYGNGDGNLFNSSDGVPYLGTQCGYGGSGCQGNPEYCSAAQGALTGAGVADCWGPNANSKSRIDIQRSGDYAAEVVTLSLAGGIGASSNVLAGNQHLAHRIGPGSSAGILGTAWLKTGNNSGGAGSSSNYTAVTEVGITMALAYSSNLGTEAKTVINGPWKHNEWANSSQSYQEHWNLGNTGCGDVTDFPYRPFMWTVSQSACNTALSNSSRTVGNFDCSDAPALRMCPGLAFDQATHFPFGTVACHQAHIKGLGTSSMSIEIKHAGTTVIKMTGFDAASALRNSTYSNFVWNAYSNINEDGDGTANDTVVTQYRYEDNIVVVNGPPEPCSAIGL